MRRKLFAFLTAGSLVIASAGASTRVEARCYGCWAGAAFAFGAIGSAIIANNAYGYYGGYAPYYRYGYAPYYYVRSYYEPRPYYGYYRPARAYYGYPYRGYYYSRGYYGRPYYGRGYVRRW